MATANLVWTPAGGGNSLSQTVQYKLAPSGVWIDHSTVGVAASTATINSLLDNTLYQFRIINNCSVGGPTPGTLDERVKFICPNVSITPSHASATFSFTHVGGNISKYTIDLLDSTGLSVMGSIVVNAPSGVVSDSFYGLTPSTLYKIRVTMEISGVTNQVALKSNICTSVDFSTIAAPICPAPSSVVATMS